MSTHALDCTAQPSAAARSGSDRPGSSSISGRGVPASAAGNVRPRHLGRDPFIWELSVSLQKVPRARTSRDPMVPTGTPRTAAISAYGIPSSPTSKATDLE
jgi:hypothetical protein